MPFDPGIFRNSKVLITGSLGSIGLAAAGRLLGLGAKTTLLDHLTPEYDGDWFDIHDIEDKVKVEIADWVP